LNLHNHCKATCQPRSHPPRSLIDPAGLQDRVRLDAILTVVDAKHVLQHLDEEKAEGVENEVSLWASQRTRLPRGTWQ
jgi:G3E family GTPase